MGVGSIPQQVLQIKLDIGCGSRKVSSDHIGLDVIKHPNIDIIASAAALPFKNESFIEVYTRRCIQHIEEDEKVLTEIFRVLQKNGKATVIVASWTGWLFFKARWLLKNKPYNIFHFYTFNKIVRKLRKHEFLVISIGRIKSTHRFGYDIATESKKQS
jgi:ubiquinone/menaquinone biosynthesis C-methylase UbiE